MSGFFPVWARILRKHEEARSARGSNATQLITRFALGLSDYARTCAPSCPCAGNALGGGGKRCGVSGPWRLTLKMGARLTPTLSDATTTSDAVLAGVDERPASSSSSSQRLRLHYPVVVEQSAVSYVYGTYEPGITHSRGR